MLVAYLQLFVVFQINHQILKDFLLFSVLVIINFGKNRQNQMDHLFFIEQVKAIVLKQVVGHQADQKGQMRLELAILLQHSCLKVHQINYYSLMMVYCFHLQAFLKVSIHLLIVN